MNARAALDGDVATRKAAAAGKAGVARRPSKKLAGSNAPAAPEGVAQPTAKQKLVRDSFTIPKDEYGVLGQLKERAAHLRRPAKKSELLRAGIAALSTMSDRAFLASLGKVRSLKTGRPKVGDA